MKNVLLLSFNGTEYLEHDEPANFKIVVNTWNDKVDTYPHEHEVLVHSKTQRLGEVMWIQSKVLRDLEIDYDHVCVYCHDVKLKVSDLNKLFEIGTTKGYDSYSPAMTSLNHSHPQFIKNGNEDKTLDWVENMVSFFSKRMYDKLIPYLDIFYEEMNLVSGWGLDRPVCQSIIRNNNYKCRLINSVVMEHTKKVTDGGIVWRNGLCSRQAEQHIIKYMNTKNKTDYINYVKTLTKDTPPTYIVK